MKANSNQAVLKTLAKLGAGADVVSEGELRRALAAGIPAGKIMFSGVGKTAREMDFALDAGILLLQRRIRAGTRAALGARRRRWARPRRSRCASIPMSMPGRTPRSRPARPRTSSASPGSARAQVYAQRRRRCPASRSSASTCISAARSPSCSPSTTPSRCCAELVGTLRADGHAIEHVDLGGGLGIPYRTDNDAAAAARRLCRDRQEACRASSACKVIVRARPADRRQCRHPGHARSST